MLKLEDHRILQTWRLDNLYQQPVYASAHCFHLKVKNKIKSKLCRSLSDAKTKLVTSTSFSIHLNFVVIVIILTTALTSDPNSCRLYLIIVSWPNLSWLCRHFLANRSNVWSQNNKLVSRLGQSQSDWPCGKPRFEAPYTRITNINYRLVIG